MKPKCGFCNDTGEIGYTYCNVQHATPCSCGASRVSRVCEFCCGLDGNHGSKCRIKVRTYAFADGVETRS